MSLLICWVVFPVVLGLLALGSGLLLERTAGARLSGALLLPAGLAVIVAVAQLATWSNATAELATPAVVVMALAGFALARPWRDRRLDLATLVPAVAVFAVFAAPVVLSGEATFAGYIKLDDTATWFAITDHVMERGRDLSGLPPSTYEATLRFNVSAGYPIGSFLPLGAARPLVGQDVAWVFQPYLAFLAAMLSLVLSALVAPMIRSAAVRGVVAFVAAQPALLFAYSLWGGVKELATAWIVALLAALAVALVREAGGPRSVLPLAAASAAAIGMLSFAAGAWLGPVLLFALVAGWLRRTDTGERALTLTHAGAFAAFAAVLAAPALAVMPTFKGASGPLTAAAGPDELGNLIQPLSGLQLAGIWPSEDFRTDPTGGMTVTYVLVGLLLLAAVFGLAWAYDRRESGILLYVGASLLGWLAAASVGSPWVDAKALTIASPAAVLTAMAGAAAFFTSGRRAVAALLALAIAGGVLWSNALAYHDVSLGPRERLAELAEIGEQIGGEGPTLIPVYEPFAARHFLRAGDPESASDLRRREVALRAGGSLDKGGAADIDEFDLGAVLTYRTLVLQRSPAASRPPSVYNLAWRGRHYEVWQRSEGPTAIASHLSLGTDPQAADTPSCREVRRLQRAAREAGARIAVVPRPTSLVLPPSRMSFPPGWQLDPGVELLYPTAPGTAVAEVEVRARGAYALWLGGSFGRGFDVLLDGVLVGDARYELNNEGQYTRVADVELEPGRHTVTLVYGDGGLRPGSSGRLRPLGRLVLEPATTLREVTYHDPRDARTLCDQSLDWIEVVPA